MRVSRLYRAKSATSRAGLTKEHERRRSTAPALRKVRAVRLLANCLEAGRLKLFFDFLEGFRRRRPDSKPRGQSGTFFAVFFRFHGVKISGFSCGSLQATDLY